LCGVSAGGARVNLASSSAPAGLQRSALASSGSGEGVSAQQQQQQAAAELGAGSLHGSGTSVMRSGIHRLDHRQCEKLDCFALARSMTFEQR